MSFSFEKLEIWKLSMELGESCNTLALNFPDYEKYNLASQIRRAAGSAALNISEGSIYQSPKEKRKFLGYSIRTTAEVVTCLYKAKYRGYLTEIQFEKYYSFCYKLMNMIIAFRKTV